MPDTVYLVEGVTRDGSRLVVAGYADRDQAERHAKRTTHRAVDPDGFERSSAAEVLGVTVVVRPLRLSEEEVR